MSRRWVGRNLKIFFIMIWASAAGAGRAMDPTWIFIHGTDIENKGLIVLLFGLFLLFFGIFSVAPSVRNFSADALV